MSNELTEAFRSLFEVNMEVKPGERILVYSDLIRDDETISDADRDRRMRLLDTAEKAARFAQDNYGTVRFISFPATAASGAEPPEALWHAAFGERIVEQLQGEGVFQPLLAKTAALDQVARAREIVTAAQSEVVDVVVALSNNSTSHTRFRALVNAAGGRFASLPNFDPEMFFTSMRVDWNALAQRTASLALEVNRAVTIELTTPNGTNMLIGKEGRVAEGDDGLLTASGSFGNLPAGEVYLAPLEGTSEGVMVLEYAPTRKLATSVTLVVKGGEVVEVRGDEPHARKLEAKFAESPLNRNIAELGIGTNDRATRPDNILEAEKILGTIHIALGDNSGFGGKVSTPFHEDYVFYNPTLTAVMPDGSRKVLLEEGRLQIV
jgi:leucyl aminopeptidase (aminopeptidase T)